MATAKKAQVIITANASVAQKVMDELQKNAQRAASEMKRLADAGKGNTAEFKKAEKEFQAFNSAIRENVKDTKRVEEVMKNLSGTATRDLRRALQAAKRELDKFAGDDPKRQKLLQDMQRIKQQIDENTGAMKKQGSALKTTLKNLVAYAGVFASFNYAKEKLMDIVRGNIALSDSMAQVQKVTGLAKGEIDDLNRSFAGLDTRTTLTQLNDLAYSAGKMGIGKYGVDGVRQFVEATNQLQVALGEDLGGSVDEAITPLAKLAENLGLLQKMGVEKSMLAIGSSINELSQTTTATGANIVDFARRIQPSAQMMNLTADEILALGSATDSLGLHAEVAATAFTKFLAAYRTNTEAIEQALGITKGALDEFFNTGRTMEGMLLIFQRMHDIGDLRYLNDVFKELGSEGSRMFETFGAFSKNIDTLRQHLETSTIAFNEATSVTREYSLVQDTAAGILQRANNIWEKAFVNPEGVDLTKEFARAWYDVSAALTSNNFAMGQLKFLLTGIMTLVKNLIYFLPALANGFAVWGIARMFLTVRNALELTKLSTVGLTLSVNGLRTAWAALSVVGRANWIGTVATAVFMAVEAFGMFNKKMKETGVFLEGFKADLGDLNVKYGEGEAELRRYRRAIDDANVGSKERLAAIHQFNSKFKPYLSNLLTEKSTAQDVANAYAEVCKQLRTKMALELKNKDLETHVKPREQWAAQRREEYDQTVSGTNNSQYGATWITGYAEDNRGKSIKEIARDLNNRVFHTAESTFNSVLDQLGNGTLNELVRTKRKVNGQTVVDESVMGPQGRQLWSALRYILQDRSAETALRRVNKKWKPETDEFLSVQDQTPTFTPPAPTPAASGSGGTDEKERLRKELRDAKQESDAIISKIEEWYRLQETTITGFAADGKWTQQQADVMIDQLNQAKNQALADARHSISGRDTKAWDNMKQQIGTLMFDTSDMSKHLLQEILDVRLENVRKLLSHIDNTGNQYGITSGSLRDSINRTAAGNLREVERIQKKSASEIEKMLKQYDFFQQAVDAFNNRLTQLGLLTESAAEAARRIQQAAAADGTPEALRPDYRTAEQQEADYQHRRSEGMAAAASRFIAGGAQSITVNYNDTQELDRWLRELTGAEGTIGTNGFEFQFASWADAFREDFDRWLRDSGKYKSEIQAFYLSLVQASDDYTEATRKAYEREKKLQDQRFEVAGYRDEEERTDTALQRDQQMKDAGVGTSLAEQLGLDKIADDPEILRIQNRIHWRNRDYEDAKRNLEAQMELDRLRIEDMQRNGATEQQIEQAKIQLTQQRAGLERLMQERQTELINETYDLTSQVAQQMQKRVDAIKDFVRPVTDFTQAAGRKIGDMIFNMKSEEATWEELWKNMALAVGESVIQMGQQYMQNYIMQKSINRASESEEMAHAATTVPAGIASGAAKTIGELGWWGIPLVAVISALLMGLLQSALGGGSNGGEAKAATPKVKLASGMLTYDEGTGIPDRGGRKSVGSGSSWRGPHGEYLSDARQTVLGDDGRMYRARTAASLPEGVSMVTQPVATMVNGQPGLVAERGPEIVIGRKTTRRLMMDEPQLLHALATVDRGITTRRIRTFDEGNIADLAQAITPASLPSPDGQTADSNNQNERIADALERNTQAMAAFTQMMANIQRDGIPAHVAKYGKGSLDEGMREISAFRKKYPA